MVPFRALRSKCCLFFLFYTLILARKCWAATDTLTQSEELLLGQTLISSGQIFELGFFTPGNSNKQYVGIWYKIITQQKVVWVANRENAPPVDDPSSRLIIGSDGNLKLTDGQQKIFWSTNVTFPSGSIIAVLSDIGNLILKDNSSGLVLWESFNFPGDTFLADMMIGFNSKTGEKRVTKSWQSEAPPQAFIWAGSEPFWRGGPWNGQMFLGIPETDKKYSNGMNVVRDNQQGTVYLTYSISIYNNSIVMMSSIAPSGILKIWLLYGGLNEWNVVWEAPQGLCAFYGACGPFGVCNKGTSPTCLCLKGFVPKSDQEWSKGNWTSGCVRRTQLTCERNNISVSSNMSEGVGFWKLGGMKLPDLYDYLYDVDAGGCQRWCLSNCSCVAYAYPTGIGCLVWLKDLLDIQQFSFGGEDLYLRLSNSDIDTKGVKRTRAKLIFIPIIIVSSIILLASFLYCFHRQRGGIRRYRVKGFLPANKDDVPRVTSHEDILAGPATSARKSAEVPLIDFARIKKATDNFNQTNKLGSGGFGTVYEGTLEDGHQIAVKRLSCHSGPRVEEFKNEVSVISKLQHRNLVRLLACCVQGEEKLLIFECLKNKSLDTFLFDTTKKLQLDWKKRFNIIEGIARGLLYLHRDSCLRIIHRDMKAGNILLDDKMNPKISDFGLARTFRVTQELGNTLRVAGTFGYMSPEYAMRGMFSEKSDVYSFGVLLLEIVSGIKNAGFPYHDESFNLPGYAWQLWNNGKGFDLVDKSLADSGSCSPSEVMRCTQIGLLCVQDQAADGPIMSNVVLMLTSETVLPQPRQPTFTFQSPDINKVYSINEVTVSAMEARTNDVVLMLENKHANLPLLEGESKYQHSWNGNLGVLFLNHIIPVLIENYLMVVLIVLLFKVVFTFK